MPMVFIWDIAANIAGGFQRHFPIAKCLQKHLDQDWGNNEIQKDKSKIHLSIENTHLGFQPLNMRENASCI